MPALRYRRPPGNDAGTFGERILDMAIDLLDRGPVDHRADGDAGLGAGTDLQGVDAGDELRGEGVVDAGLHEDAVGAHAGLAAIAEFRRERALDGEVEVGIVEDDEGRVA